VPDGSRIPFCIAAVLGLAAVVLLWSRPARTGASRPRAPAAAAVRESVPEEARASPPRAPPPLEAPAPEEEASGKDDAEGRLLLEGLSPGQPSRVEAEGGATFITGRTVWSQSGAPAEGVAVYLDRQVAARGDARTDGEGRFRLGDVRPGVHTVRLLAPNGRPETRTVKVVEGEGVDLGDVTVAARRATPGTVGAGFSEERGHVAFAWLTPEGPAARAGLRVGERLVAVDGVVVRNRQEAESRTRGTPGTPVRLSVRRASGEEHHVRLSRAD
jgi:hypothetical protein